MTATSGYRRWYDKNSYLSKMTSHIKAMDPMILTFLAQGVLEYIQQAKERKYRGFLSPTNIVGLYLSNKGQRWYDRDPIIRRFFTLVQQLPETEQESVALRMLDLVGLVQDYLQLTGTLADKGIPHTPDLKRLSLLYIRSGRSHVQRYLSLLRQAVGPMETINQPVE